MSPKKITDTDKLEITHLYRQSGETTASLANRYGVSNSTISRLLKTTIPEAEYEELIQQKRGVKIGIEDEVVAEPYQSNSLSEPLATHIDRSASVVLEPKGLQLQLAGEIDRSISIAENNQVLSAVPLHSIEMETPAITEDLDPSSRRVRRRSSAPVGDLVQSVAAVTPMSRVDELDQPITPNNHVPPIAVPAAEPNHNFDLPTIEAKQIYSSEKTTVSPPVPRLPVLRTARPQQDAPDYFTNNSLIIPDQIEPMGEDESEEEDTNEEDVSILAAMFGEEIADGDEDDEDDEDDDVDDESGSSYQQLDRDRLLTIDRLHIQVTPLSEATLPRTCYIVIDKFAELIVRPLKDFADLGQIPGEEIQQRTLPIFDNHRVAKRFSNQRTQRVIKVPDSKVFHKTCHHLRSKGITRLLVDGNIYSLN
jgi:transposase-like protein